MVLVLQGGGALGAYQAGVYQALMEGGIEPDWVIGTSIGAINGALIAGNEPANRIARLREFWDGVGRKDPLDQLWPSSIFGNSLANLSTIMSGIPGFFAPNPQAIWGPTFPLGIEKASYYSTEPLQGDARPAGRFRLPEPAARSGSRSARSTCAPARCATSTRRRCRLAAAHVMASGALPPAFPAVTIDGESYWDGGIYSNTPIEVVLDDVPRRNSLIFSVNVWQPSGAHPTTIQQVMARHKDIQFASRGKSHVARQAQIHRLRHVVRELANRLPPEMRADPVVQDLAEYGCGTLMHLVRLLSPRLDGEDHTKDIDFTRSGIEKPLEGGLRPRAQGAGREAVGSARPTLLAGVVIHEASE